LASRIDRGPTDREREKEGKSKREGKKKRRTHVLCEREREKERKRKRWLVDSLPSEIVRRETIVHTPISVVASMKRGAVKRGTIVTMFI